MGYCDDKAPDSRIDTIRATADKAQKEPEIPPCKKCNGFGEVAILNDEKKVVGSKVCDECQGAGAVA